MTTRTTTTTDSCENAIAMASEARRTIPRRRIGLASLILAVSATMGGGCAVTSGLRIGLGTGSFTSRDRSIDGFSNFPKIWRDDSYLHAGAWKNEMPARTRAFRFGHPKTNLLMSLEDVAIEFATAEANTSTLFSDRIDLVLGYADNLGSIGTLPPNQHLHLDKPLALTLGGDPPTARRANIMSAENPTRSWVIAATHGRPQFEHDSTRPLAEKKRRRTSDTVYAND